MSFGNTKNTIIAKIALLIVSLLASKFSFAGPIIKSIQNYIDNNYPVSGYIILSILIIFIGFLIFSVEKGEEIFKYIILDRIVGIAFVFLAFFVIYTKFFQ